MNIRILIKNILTLFLAIVIIEGCAKVSSPAGGPKDRVAPVVLKSEPVNGSKNFRGTRISIAFNEYVVLDKINEKFMVSPPMSKKPRVFLKGKSVIIDFDEKLKDSTTYTFYFQDAIRDLNEGNTIDNFQFVLSTGPVIDSLSVTGNVLSAFTLDPPENTIVLLYRELSDSAVIKKLPEYISKTDKKGYFRIDNVKGGIYRLYALKDADNNRNFNLPDEEIAFISTPVIVTSEKNYLPLPSANDTIKKSLVKINAVDTVTRKGEYKLILFQPAKKTHYLTSSSRSAPYKLTYTLSLPPDSSVFDFSIPQADRKSYLREDSKNRDTMLIWLTDSSLYSQNQLTTIVGYPFTDSTGKTDLKRDTIVMRYLVPRVTRGRTRPEPFKVNSNLVSGFLKPGQQIIFKSQTPLREPDTSRIRLYEMRQTNKINVPYTLINDTASSCDMTLRAKLTQENAYLLIADSAAFGDIFGKVSDSTGIRFMVKGEKSFGTLQLNIKNFTGVRIVQLLSQAEKIVSERVMKSDGKIEFKYLDLGKYKLRIIYDLNNDGRWTTGDFLSGKQPEPVSFYNQELDIREGWVAVQDWDVSGQNIKKIKSATFTVK
jgi:hypothetical protein